MILIQKEIPENCDIVLHGDLHYGSRFCHKKGIQKLITWLGADPQKRFFGHMGDAIGAISTADKRFQYEGVSEPIPLQQAEKVIELYEPVKKQGIFWLKGNHENTLHRFGNLAKMMAEGLGIPYGTWSCKVKFVDNKGEQIFKLFASHGIRGRLTSNAKDYEQQTANMKASMKVRLKDLFGDCLVMAFGHTHLLLVAGPVKRLVLVDDDKEIHQKYIQHDAGTGEFIDPDSRWYVNTGSFEKKYVLGIDGYAERFGLKPIMLGYAVIEIRKGKVSKVRDVYI